MKNITELEHLDEVLEQSKRTPVLVYKHSDMCGTAWHAEGLVNEANEQLADDPVEFYKLEVRKARPLSNAFAEKLGVRHESPQALLIVNGEVVWHASHGGIRTRLIVEAVRESATGAPSDA